MGLTEKKLEALTKPGRRPKKPRKLGDSESLYVLLTPSGGVLWRFNYRFGGKAKTLALGRWPVVSVVEARRRRTAAQSQLADGIDPCATKQQRKRAAAEPSRLPTFEDAAREWHATKLDELSAKYGSQILIRLEADAFPLIGKKRFAELRRDDPEKVLARIQERGAFEAAKRMRMYITQIYRFAGRRDKTIEDPSPWLKGVVKTRDTRHHPMLPPRELGKLIVKIANYDRDHAPKNARKQGDEPTETRLALMLTLHTAARTSEIIEAEWSEFSGLDDADNAMWSIPAERMKAGDPHMIPLSKQTCRVLKQLHERTGEGRYLFPAPWGRIGHMSNNAMLFALYRMGYRSLMTVHGMRRCFSTWANENITKAGNKWTPDDIELCLAHDERNKVRGSYNAAQRLDERRVLLQAWSSNLDKLQATARLVG